MMCNIITAMMGGTQFTVTPNSKTIHTTAAKLKRNESRIGVEIYSHFHYYLYIHVIPTIRTLSFYFKYRNEHSTKALAVTQDMVT